MELRADRGRAVLVGNVGQLSAVELPEPLADALHQWAEVVDTVSADGAVDPELAARVSARGRQLARRLAAVVGSDVGYADPVRGVVERVPAPPDVRSSGAAHAEPTPWATGLTVSAFTGVVVVVSVVTLTVGLAKAHPLLAVAGNLVVAVGLAPSLWVSRLVPVWRWMAFGVAAGVPVAWAGLLLSTLG